MWVGLGMWEDSPPPECVSSWLCWLCNYVTMTHGQQNIKFPVLWTATCFDGVRKITLSAIFLELRLSGLKELKQTWRCPQCSYRSQIEICFIIVCHLCSCRTVGEVTAPGQQGNCQHFRLPNLETIHRQQYCSLNDTGQRQEVWAPPQGREKTNAHLWLISTTAVDLRKQLWPWQTLHNGSRH
jgi:hypothetical protein